jgi:hypothetical protein
MKYTDLLFQIIIIWISVLVWYDAWFPPQAEGHFVQACVGHSDPETDISHILKSVHPTDVPYSWCVIDVNR